MTVTVPPPKPPPVAATPAIPSRFVRSSIGLKLFGVVVVLYHFCLEIQGSVLHSREIKILETVMIREEA